MKKRTFFSIPHLGDSRAPYSMGAKAPPDGKDCENQQTTRSDEFGDRRAKIADPSTHRGSAESQVRSVYQRSSTGTHADAGKGCPPPVKANPRFRTASPSRVRFAAPKRGTVLHPRVYAGSCSLVMHAHALHACTPHSRNSGGSHFAPYGLFGRTPFARGAPTPVFALDDNLSELMR